VFRCLLFASANCSIKRIHQKYLRESRLFRENIATRCCASLNKARIQQTAKAVVESGRKNETTPQQSHAQAKTAVSAQSPPLERLPSMEVVLFCAPFRFPLRSLDSRLRPRRTAWIISNYGPKRWVRGRKKVFNSRQRPSVGCTRISADFAFSFARAKFYLTAAELFEAFLGNTDAVSPATDGSLILAGNYLLDSDELPLYLLADPIRDELLHAREVHLQALETLAIAQTLVRRTLKQFA
jgi:hypothetical protein